MEIFVVNASMHDLYSLVEAAVVVHEELLHQPGGHSQQLALGSR